MDKDEFLKLSCKHEEAYTRSKYEGDKLIYAVTYCRDCQEGFEHKIDKPDAEMEGKK